MEDRTVLLTGCSSGIGRSSARSFRENGWTVYATAPEPADLTALADRGCEIAALDVTDERTIDAVVDRIERERGQLDCLVNNAGYGQLGPIEDVPTAAVREQFDVNVFGPHRLVRATLPLLRRGDSGTVLNVSSIYGRYTMPGQGAYCSSKFALEAMSHTLRTELAGSGIDVVLVEPGPVETRFGETALETRDRLEPSGMHEWFYRLYRTRRAIDKAPGFVQPERVARTLLDAAESDRPDARYVVGPYKASIPLVSLVPSTVRDTGFAVVRRLAERDLGALLSR